jgi:hypothetical protein
MKREFKFIELDKTVLPDTKGKNINGTRFYEIDGQNYPSITSVLSIRSKEGLQKWRDSIGEDVAKWEMGRAARRGKSAHTLVEEYIKGETPSVRAVLPLGLFKLLRPYVDQINNIHCLETIMYSKKLKIAGQTDCIGEYNGKLSVIDFKTANKFREESWVENYFLQTAAYAQMYEDLYGTPIEQLVILIASEDGTSQAFIKEKKEYDTKLVEAIDSFYKYYQQSNIDKIKQKD